MTKRHARKNIKPLSQAEMDIYSLHVTKWLTMHGGTHTNDPLDPRTRAYYRRMFDLIDSDGSGALAAEELLSALRYIGFRISTKEMKRRLAAVDENHNGEIDFNEFVHFMVKSTLDFEQSTDGIPLPFYLWIPAFLRRSSLDALMKTGVAPPAAIESVKQWSLTEAQMASKDKEKQQVMQERRFYRGSVASKLTQLEKELTARAKKARLRVRHENLEDPNTVGDLLESEPLADLMALESKPSPQRLPRRMVQSPRVRALNNYLEAKTHRGHQRSLPVQIKRRRIALTGPVPYLPDIRRH